MFGEDSAGIEDDAIIRVVDCDLNTDDNIVETLSVVIDSDTELLCASGNGRGTCLVRTSGDLILQGEATLGVAFTF